MSLFNVKHNGHRKNGFKISYTCIKRLVKKLKLIGGVFNLLKIL